MKNKTMENLIFLRNATGAFDDIDEMEKELRALSEKIKNQSHWNLENVDDIRTKLNKISSDLECTSEKIVMAARKASGQYTDEGRETLADNLRSVTDSLFEGEEPDDVKDYLDDLLDYENRTDLYYFTDTPEGEEIEDVDFTNRGEVERVFW